jgi:hypothetical protein
MPATLNLLPRKVFEIKREDGTVITGQYSLWSVKRFCDKKSLTLSQLETYLSAQNITMDDMCLLILCAVEYVSRKNKHGFSFTDIDVCDWIDELGGLQSDNYTMLMAHARTEDSTEQTENSEEKKSPLNSETLPG